MIIAWLFCALGKHVCCGMVACMCWFLVIIIICSFLFLFILVSRLHFIAIFEMSWERESEQSMWNHLNACTHYTYKDKDTSNTLCSSGVCMCVFTSRFGFFLCKIQIFTFSFQFAPISENWKDKKIMSTETTTWNLISNESKILVI